MDETPVFRRKKAKPRDSGASARSFGAGSAPSTPAAGAEGEEDEGNVAISRKKKASGPGKLKERERQASRLSFGDADGDEDEAPKPNRRLLRPQDSGTVATLDSSSGSRPSYSASDLAQLRSETLATPGTSDANGYDDLTRSKFSSLALSASASGDAVDDETRIPTSTTINAARERRQLARKTGLNPATLSNAAADDDGFIPLSSSTSVVPSGASKGGESRLVREEDEIGTGEDEHAEYTGAGERVALGRRAGLAAEKKRREGIVELIDDAEEEDEEAEDEEDRAWEAAQVRRSGWTERQDAMPVQTKVHRSAAIPESSTLPTMNGVQARIKSALAEALALEQEQATLAEQLGREDDDLMGKEEELRAGVEKANAKDSWFNDFRTFVEDVAAFLKAKWPALEKVEADMRSILAERAEMIWKRRLEDVSDDLARWTGSNVPAKIPVLDATGDGDEGDGDTKMDEGDLDELGRLRPEKDLSPDGPLRVSRREQRMSRKRRRGPPKTEEDDGFSTDDDLVTADASDLSAASASLTAAAASIFADVANAEFRSPTAANGLADRFAGWRANFLDEYRNAFGGLALVQAWEFWARVEMVRGWNVWGIKEWSSQSGEGQGGLETWEWRQGLEDYEHREGLPPETDGLVGAMVTSVVIPALSQLARSSYDPFSAVATSRALQLVEEVGYVVDRATSGSYESLVLSFASRFQSAVAELKYVVSAALAAPSRRDGGQEGEAERRRVLAKAVKLLQQGLRWRRHAKGMLLSGADGAIGGGTTLERFLGSELVGKTVVPLMERGPSADLAQRVSKACPFGVLDEEVARRVQAACSDAK